jgi:hypothetical protein
MTSLCTQKKKRYSCYPLEPSTLEGVATTPMKEPASILQEAVWSSGPVGVAQKI